MTQNWHLISPVTCRTVTISASKTCFVTGSAVRFDPAALPEWPSPGTVSEHYIACVPLCPARRHPMACSPPSCPLHGVFLRQESWSGVPFPSPGNLPDPEIEPGSPAWQADSLPPSHQSVPERNRAPLGKCLILGVGRDHTR